MVDSRPKTDPADPRKRNCARAAALGFSLLEVVLVLLIIGIMASITVPRVAKVLAVQRVEAAAHRIAADLALAQRQARIASTAKKIGFDVAGDSYALSGVRHLSRAGATYTVKLTDEPYGVKLVSANFDGDTELTFDGYGVPDSGGSAVVACSAESYRITVAAQTGAVTVARIVAAEPEAEPEPLPQQGGLPEVK